MFVNYHSSVYTIFGRKSNFPSCLPMWLQLANLDQLANLLGEVTNFLDDEFPAK